MELVQPPAAPVEMAPAPQPPAPLPQPPAPAPSFEGGGPMDQLAKPKMSALTIGVLAAIIVVCAHGIWYYRKANQKLRDQPSTSEFDDLAAQVKEIGMNIKTAMGKNYKKLT